MVVVFDVGDVPPTQQSRSNFLSRVPAQKQPPTKISLIEADLRPSFEVQIGL